MKELINLNAQWATEVRAAGWSRSRDKAWRN